MIWQILLVSSSIVTLWVSTKLWRTMSQYSYHPTIADEWFELPTVSVCIAARNETHALAQNLEYILTSDYKKLEILVLDDNSADDTSLIIKSFAHAGVRFIAGKSLPNGWLGRNHAYQTLAEEASGEYVLFLDVDTLLDPTTISQLVHQALANHKTMVSVLPRRDDSLRTSALLGTLRYVWELVLSTTTTPPSSSAVWMIHRNTLLGLDKNLRDYSMSVQPEQHIAKILQKTNNYLYLISTAELGVRYEKKWHSQRETAERLYFPLFGRSIKHFFRTVLFFIVLIAPIVAIAFSHDLTYIVWAVLLLITGLVSFGRFMYQTYKTPAVFIRVLLWPYLLVQDFSLYLISSYRYATHTVTWKNRAILAQPRNKSHYEINE